MSKISISIITATYNSADTIEDTLISVRDQTYKDIEHIIIDGMSTDDTLKIVNRFPHISKSFSGKDGGIYDAMNKGIFAASGQIIGILNSDDIYAHPSVLEKVASAFEDPMIDAVYADLEYVANRDLNKTIRHWKSGSYTSRSFYWGWMPPHPTFFVRKELYEKFGVFNLSLSSSADYELMLRFLLRYQIKAYYIPEVLVKMRVGGQSNKNMQSRFIANRQDKMAWKINELRPYYFTFFLKPTRKVFQYIRKPKQRFD